MNLTEVHRNVHRHKKPNRVGRGPGSGHGKTAGRGHKGQGQLSGWSSKPWFEGGQFPLVRRVPKRGFNNRFARQTEAVNLGELDSAYVAGEEVSPTTLLAKGLITTKCEVVKILAHGTLGRKVKISAHAFSATALEKIKAAGGEAVVLPGPAPVVKNVKRNRSASKKRKPAAK